MTTLPPERDDESEFTDVSSLLWVASRGKPLPASPKRGGFAGAHWLVGASPAAVLRRIVDGDPLALERRCNVHVREQSLLIDAERLLARVFAHVARESMHYAGEPALERWLSGQLARSVEELLAEDLEAVREGEGFAPEDEVAQRLVRAVGLPHDQTRRAAALLNQLPAVTRRDFHAIVLSHATLDEHIAAGCGPREAIEANLQRALRAISVLTPPPADGGAR